MPKLPTPTDDFLTDNPTILPTVRLVDGRTIGTKKRLPLYQKQARSPYPKGHLFTDHAQSTTNRVVEWMWMLAETREGSISQLVDYATSRGINKSTARSIMSMWKKADALCKWRLAQLGIKYEGVEHD